MKFSERLTLREEGAPQSWIDDPFLMAQLINSENERINAEAREEFLVVANSAELPDMFGAPPKTWDWTPKPRYAPTRKLPRTPVANPTDDLQSQIAYQEKQQKRAYKRDIGKNTLSWVGKESEVKAGLLHNSIKEAFELAPETVAYRSVWLWIRLPDWDNPFAFSECCPVLNQDADILRGHLNGMRREALDHNTWIESERELLTYEIIECIAKAKTPPQWDHVGQLKDNLAQLDEETDKRLFAQDVSRRLHRELDHLQIRVLEHVRSFNTDDDLTSGWLLEPKELRAMVKNLGEIQGKTTSDDDLNRITVLKQTITELLATSM